MDTRKPEFHIVLIKGMTTYSITIPNNAEGIAMLDEVGRMFSHRGEYDTAKRIARVVTNRKEQLRSPTPGTQPDQKSKPSVSKDGCFSCGAAEESRAHNRSSTRFSHDFVSDT